MARLDDKSVLIGLALFALLALASASTLPIIKEVSVQDLFEEQRKNICEQTMPCMWEVYEPGPSSYFIPTDCHCPEHLRCMVSNEELSVSAYVYTCQPPNPLSRRYPIAAFRSKRRYYY